MVVASSQHEQAMSDAMLTERQKRERDYYSEYSKRNAVTNVNFDAVLGQESRPWNSYWCIYETAAEYFEGPHQKMLDFGCGMGEAAMCYAHVGYETYGFDICPGNIEHCQRLAEKYEFADRCHFSVQAAENLSYDDEAFDVVAGIDILHHIEIEPAIKEVHRVLKPGGRAIFREFVEVPIFDKLRTNRLVTMVFPKDMSLEDHRTHDEKKLSKEDIQTVKSVFAEAKTHRFCLTSRLHRIIKPRHPDRASPLEKFDFALLRVLPFLNRFGGEIVFVLTK